MGERAEESAGWGNRGEGEEGGRLARASLAPFPPAREFLFRSLALFFSFFFFGVFAPAGSRLVSFSWSGGAAGARARGAARPWTRSTTEVAAGGGVCAELAGCVTL